MTQSHCEGAQRLKQSQKRDWPRPDGLGTSSGISPSVASPSSAARNDRVLLEVGLLRNLSGFTLVEIMISVLILGVGLTLVANSYLVALRGINITANNIGALNLAKEKMEALEVLSLKDGLLASTTRESLKTPAKNYDWTQSVVEIIQPEVLAEHLMLACFSLNWQEQNAPKNVTLSTYLLKQKQ